MIKKTIACIAVSAFLASCYPYLTEAPYYIPQDQQKENVYYIPTAPTAPLLKEQGDLSGSVSYAFHPKFEGTEIHGAALPHKQIGVSAGYVFGDNDNAMDYRKFEFGGGYVKQFSKGWHFETYAGFGNSRIDNYSATGYSKIKQNLFYIQPAICISNNKQTVQLALISRFSKVNFKVTDTLLNSEREAFSKKQINNLYEKPNHLIWDPSLTFSVGWPNILLHTKITFSSDFTSPAVYRAGYLVSIGGTLRFNVNH